MKVTLINASLMEWELTAGPRGSAVLAPEGELQALVGSVSRSDIQRPVRSGVVPGVRRFGALTATPSFYLHADDAESMQQLWRNFRRGWSADVASSLVVDAGHPAGVCAFDLFLDKPIPGPSVVPEARLSMVVQVPVFCPSGLAWSEVLTGTGSVTVTNFGDVPVWPKIRWVGSGGVVTCPSGATFTLPSSGTPREVVLDPMLNRMDGVLCENVPPGRSGTWVLPTGATLQWRLGVADPWA